jgi:hypothetical protein
VTDEHVPLREHFEELRTADREAIRIALDAAKEKSRAHNDILGAMREQQATYVTKDAARWAFTAMLSGGALVTAVFVAIRSLG